MLSVVEMAPLWAGDKFLRKQLVGADNNLQGLAQIVGDHCQHRCVEIVDTRQLGLALVIVGGKASDIMRYWKTIGRYILDFPNGLHRTPLFWVSPSRAI
ncbi:MAG: hypothetical protein WB611_21370 [Stellaceae bacterium]